MPKRVKISSEIISDLDKKATDIAKGLYDEEKRSVEKPGNPLKVADFLDKIASDAEGDPMPEANKPPKEEEKIEAPAPETSKKKEVKDVGEPPKDQTAQVEKKEPATLPKSEENEVKKQPPAKDLGDGEKKIPETGDGEPPKGSPKTAAEKMYECVEKIFPQRAEKKAAINPGVARAVKRVLPGAIAGGASYVAGREVQKDKNEENIDEVFQIGMQVGAQQLASALMQKLDSEMPGQEAR